MADAEVQHEQARDRAHDQAHVGPGPGVEPRSRRRWGRWVALAGLVAIGAWLFVAGREIRAAERHARAGEEALRAVVDLADTEELSSIDFAAVERDLDLGSAELGAARAAIDHRSVRALGFVPVVGRQLASARALVHTSDDVVAALGPLVDSARTAQDSGAELDRVEFLQTTTTQLTELASVLDGADLGPTDNLVGPLADGRDELEERLGDLAVDIESYRTVTAGLADFLADSTYLVLGANNAEMNLATGMHLSVGEVDIDDGEFDLPGLVASADVFPVDGVDVVDDDVADRWGFLVPANDFRKLGYSGRFDEFSGPQAVELWAGAAGRQVDGVIALDPFVLDALLGVVGEVEIDGERFGQGSVLRYLLQEQYAAFDLDERDERRDRLSEIARATVDRLGSSEWDPVEMIDVLRPLARGRHLLAYSRHETQQAAWAELGVTGAVPAEATGVYLLNVGGSKLDPFVEVRVDMTELLEGEERVIGYDIEVINRAPADGLPDYVVGPWRLLELDGAGVYQARLAVYAPGFTTEADFERAGLSAFGRDGAALLAATQPFEIGPGGRQRFRFEFRIPSALETMTLVPSTRFPAVRWTVGGESGRAFDDTVERAIDLGDE